MKVIGTNQKEGDRKMRTAKYDPKKVIASWNKAEDPKEAAAATGLTREQITQLASTFRKKGIFMKNMKKGPDKSDLNELIQFSKKYEKQVGSSLN
jgi:hypothetical protein